MRQKVLLPLAFLAAFVPAAAQIPACRGTGTSRLSLSPAVFGTIATATLAGPAGSPFLWYLDTADGNVPIPGVGPVCLGLGPGLLLILDSAQIGLQLPPSGSLVFPYLVPPNVTLLGQGVFSQFAVADPALPSGVGLSEPASIQFTLPDWQLATLAPMGSWRGLHTATRCGDGRFVLVAGGGGGTLIAPTPVPSTEIYDSYTRRFIAGPPMAQARVLHTATRLADGRVLITGGLDAMATYNHSDAEVYDPATNTFTPVANSMQVPRAGHTATLLPDGRVFIAGGNQIFAVTGTSNYIQIFSSGNDSTDFYDPATNAFSPGPLMRIGTGPTLKRFGHEALLLPTGKVLLAGGISGGVNLIITAVPTYATQAYLFDPAPGTFSSAGTLSQGRLKPALELLPGGDALVAGGAGGATLATTATAERWQSQVPGFVQAGSAPQDFALAAWARLQDGSVAILGGGSGALAQFAPIAQSVRFTVAQGFTPGNALTAPVMNHALAPLADGTFLLAGGVDGSGIATAQAWVWTP